MAITKSGRGFWTTQRTPVHKVWAEKPTRGRVYPEWEIKAYHQSQIEAGLRPQIGLARMVPRMLRLIRRYGASLEGAYRVTHERMRRV